MFSALNPQAITVNQPCHAKEIGNNTLLSYNVGTTLTLSDFIGVCLSWFLEKIACRREDSSLTKCVNESSTSPLCYSNTVDIYYKRSLDGNYTIFVSVPNEVIRKYSPVNVTAHFKGTSPDLTCYHNGPDSGMLLNMRYIWMIRCRIILMTYTTNNRMEGVLTGVSPYPRVNNQRMRTILVLLSHIPLKLHVEPS